MGRGRMKLQSEVHKLLTSAGEIFLGVYFLISLVL